MDPFLRYLIAINVVAFLAFAIDHFLCVRYPALDESAVNSLVLDAFPLAGGAVGTLLALFVFTGMVSGRRMNKHNVACWLLAIVCLLAWGIGITVAFGLVSIDLSVESLLSGWDLDKLKVLGVYLAIVNVLAFALFAWDKHVAASGNDYGRRVPEAHLLGLSLLGGSIGGLIAMHAFRHKTKKWYFVWGLPAFAVLDVVLVLYFHLAGLL